MNTSDQTVQVTVQLPKEVYDRVLQIAAREAKHLDEFLPSLVDEGLDVHATTREILERVSESYRARLAEAGKLEQSPEEVLQELREQGEQIAHELYP